MTKPQAAVLGVCDGLLAGNTRYIAPDYRLTIPARSMDKFHALADTLRANPALLDATDRGEVVASLDARLVAHRDLRPLRAVQRHNC